MCNCGVNVIYVFYVSILFFCNIKLQAFFFYKYCEPFFHDKMNLSSDKMNVNSFYSQSILFMVNKASYIICILSDILSCSAAYTLRCFHFLNYKHTF